jgi:glycoside/pentoside/hexuronide:cation symporter, GPH family
MTASFVSAPVLARRAKLFYGVGDVGNALVNSAVQFFLVIYYTDAAMLNPALVGTALLVAKAWDAVNDPLFGWLSDRVKATSLGKRRIFMIVGAIPLALSIALLWRVPEAAAANDVLAFVWVLGSFVLFDTLWTATNVPYYALSGELTEDYDERSSLTSYRMVLSVPAYLIGAALTPALVALFPSKAEGYATVGLLYGVVAALALLISAAGLRERPEISSRTADAPPWRTFGEALKNRPFVRLLLIYFTLNLAFALIKTLMIYFLTYQSSMAAETSLVMGLMLIVVILALFPWQAISRRWDKGPAYAAGMGIGALAVALTFFLPPGPTPWIYPIAALAGFGFSAQWVFPWAMVPDVVDHDRVTSGEQRSGMYFGVWGLATKLSEALALAATGWLLALVGYVPNVAQQPGALLGIRFFFGPLPAILIAICLPLLVAYPLTRAAHRKILAALEGR